MRNAYAQRGETERERERDDTRTIDFPRSSFTVPLANSPLDVICREFSIFPIKLIFPVLGKLNTCQRGVHPGSAGRGERDSWQLPFSFSSRIRCTLYIARFNTRSLIYRDPIDSRDLRKASISSAASSAVTKATSASIETLSEKSVWSRSKSQVNDRLGNDRLCAHARPCACVYVGRRVHESRYRREEGTIARARVDRNDSFVPERLPPSLCERPMFDPACRHS